MLPAWTTRLGQTPLPAITLCQSNHSSAPAAQPPQLQRNTVFLFVSVGIELILTTGLLPETAKGSCGRKGSSCCPGPKAPTGLWPLQVTCRPCSPHRQAYRGGNTTLEHPSELMPGYRVKRKLQHKWESPIVTVLQYFPRNNLHHLLAQMIFFSFKECKDGCTHQTR